MVPSDRCQRCLVGGGWNEPQPRTIRRLGELAELRLDRLIECDQLVGARCGLGPTHDVRGRGLRSRPQREELPDLCRVGLQLTVGRGPNLQRLEPLDPSVGLTEHAEAEDLDHDEQHDDADERDVQLGSGPYRDPPDGSNERVVRPITPPRLRPWSVRCDHLSRGRLSTG